MAQAVYGSLLWKSSLILFCSWLVWFRRAIVPIRSKTFCSCGGKQILTMRMTPIEQQFRDFVEFAACRLEGGGEAKSLEELVQQWRHDAEYSAAVADVRHSIDP